MSVRRMPLLAVGLAVALLVPVATAPANHHFMKATEVLGGVEGAPNVQFVELQMWLGGQNVVNGASLQFQDPTGLADGTFTFPGNVASGVDNDTILIATSAAAVFFGIAPDLTMSPVMDPAGGKVEFVGKPSSGFGVIDAFSWGSFSGSSTGSGTPFAVGSGLPLGFSANRLIAGGTVPGQLDNADDTGQSEADWDPGSATPRNNAGATTTTAGTLGTNAGVMEFDAAAGVKNVLTVSGPTGGFYRAVDAAAPITAAGDCTNLAVNVVRCPTPSVASADVDLGDQDDRLTVSSALNTTAHGGTGKDSVLTGSGNDTLNGGDSADTLFGAAGNDTMSGDAGNDTLDGGGGGDTFNGDAGFDKASYSTRPASSPVQVDIDGVNDDGGTVDGNADNVTATIEVVIGGAGADSLTGGPAADTLVSGAGADTVDGGGGDDMLDGGTGADNLDGGANTDTVTYALRLAGQGVQVDIDDVADDGGGLDGNADNVHSTVERVTGGAGDDTLTGSTAANTLFGGAGVDVLDGGPGNDNLDGGDGADTFIGGTGTDAVTYAGRAAAVQVDIDDVADDGGVLDGNADNVRLTVERLTGGNGGDTLRGSAAVNLIMGGPGADTMFGEGGNDQMKALDGTADDISCGSGTDTLDRDAGLDVFPVAGAEACETLTP